MKNCLSLTWFQRVWTYGEWQGGCFLNWHKEDQWNDGFLMIEIMWGFMMLVAVQREFKQSKLEDFRTHKKDGVLQANIIRINISRVRILLPFILPPLPGPSSWTSALMELQSGRWAACLVAKFLSQAISLIAVYTLPETNRYYIYSTWKWMVGRWDVFWGGRPIFRGELAVSFREGKFKAFCEV